MIAAAKSAKGRRGVGVTAAVKRVKQKFLAGMDDDLDTPAAVHALIEFTEAMNDSGSMSADEARAVLSVYSDASRILGLFQDAQVITR